MTTPHKREHPCRVCGGSETDPRGQGERCHGFLSSDEKMEYCSREESAGSLSADDDGLFRHWIEGECRCGKTHGSAKSSGSTIAAEYDYRDEAGAVLFQVVRKVPKDFPQRHKDASGEWAWNMDGVRRVLYRLPELLSADPEEVVFIVEGEKDADRLASVRLVATTNPGGVLKWRSAYSEHLKGRLVVILPDNDEKGREHAADVRQRLEGIAKSVLVLELPGLPPKGDVSDWLDAGHTDKELLQLVVLAPTPKDKPAEEPQAAPEKVFRVLSFGAFEDLVLPEPKLLLHPWLHDEETVLLFAPRGVGKTLVSFGGIAAAVASGGSFLAWRAPEPRRVLYVDGELPERKLQGRTRLARKMLTDAACDPRENLRILSAGYNRGAPNLAEEAGRAAIEEHLDGVELLVLDAVSTLCRGGVENEAESWQPIQDWIISLRARGITVLADHHAGKSGQQRGTSKREDVFDWIIKLAHPKDYAPKDGARFEVHFEKTRDFEGGRDLDPIEARIEQQDGRPIWTWKILEAAVEEKMLRLSRDGLTVREIGKEVHRDHSNVVRFLKKAKETGRLPFEGDFR